MLQSIRNNLSVLHWTMLRRYVIGDVHGCYTELLALEHALRKDAEKYNARPFFFFVGDLIDRGPQSKEVLRHILHSPDMAGVLGNHDELMLQVIAMAGGISLPNIPPANYSLDSLLAHWCSLGGSETLISYGLHSTQDIYKTITAIPDEHIEFLTSLPLLYYDEDLIISHAFGNPESLAAAMEGSVNKEQRSSLLWERSPPQSRFDAARMHVSGHTPINEVIVNRELGYVQLDTACVFGNKLSAYSVEDGCIFSHPAISAGRSDPNSF